MTPSTTPAASRAADSVARPRVSSAAGGDADCAAPSGAATLCCEAAAVAPGCWPAGGPKNGAGRLGSSVPCPGGVAGAIATVSAGPGEVVVEVVAGPASAGAESAGPVSAGTAAGRTGTIVPGTSRAANRYQAADQPSGVGSHHSSGS